MRNKKIIIFVCIIICLVIAFGLMACDTDHKDDNQNNNSGENFENDFGFDPDNMTKVEVDGFEYGISNDVAMLYKDKTQSEFIKVPKEVTVNGVTYPVKGIEEKCFVDNLALKNIYIGNHIMYAGKNLFSDNMERAYLRMYMSIPTGWDSKWKVTESGVVCDVVLDCLDYVIGEEYDYAEFSDKIEIKEYKGTQTDIVVPREINGKKITRFGYAFQNATQLKSVYILDNIEYVDAYAFGNCSPDLKIYYQTKDNSDWDFFWDNMTHPNEEKFRFTTKGNVAKYNCTYEDFEYVVYNDNTIELTAYKGDGVNIIIPSTIEDTEVVYFGDIFKELTNLQSVYIPDTIERMTSYAFKGSSNAIIINQNVSKPDSWLEDWEWGLENVFWDCQNVFGEYNGFNYILRNDDTMLIYNYAGTDKDLVIPEKINDYPVVEFYNKFENTYNFDSVTIPSTIKKIGKGRLFGNANIGTLKYEGTLSQWCNVDIDNYSSSVPYKIDVFDIADENFVDGVLTIPEDITTIKANSFKSMQNINQVVLHQNISEIGDYAFENCDNLTAINLPDKIKSIGRNAFYSCQQMGEITLPAGLEKIGAYAFAYMPIKEIVIPENVTTIRERAFYYCRQLENVTLPDSLNAIYQKAFEGCVALQYIEIPSSVEYVYNEIFLGCPEFLIVCQADSMPVNWNKDWDLKDDNDRHIVLWGESTITQNEEYEYIISDNEITLTKYLGNDTQVVVPEIIDGLPVISISKAYANNTNIVSIEVGGHIKHIFQNAFEGCDELEKIVLNEGVESIGSNTISAQPLKELYLPSSIKEIQRVMISTIINLYYAGTLEEWCNIDFEYWHVDITHMYIDGVSMNGTLTIPQSVTQIKPYTFMGWDGINEVALHDKVTAIGDYAFRNSSIQQINLPDSITEIGVGAFYLTKLESVVLPDSITEISNYLFSSCTNLNSVVLPQNLQSIGIQAFSRCTGLVEISSFPRTLTKIDIYAFEYTKLDKLFIPNSMTYIGDYAFSNTNLTIYCEMNTDTSKWAKNWNMSSGNTRLEVIFEEFKEMQNSEYVYLVYGDNIKLVDYIGTQSNVIVPEYIDDIPVVDIGNAYRDNDVIASLNVGGHIKDIKDYAFADCLNLKEVYINDGVEKIGIKVFAGSNNITCLQLTKTIKQYTYNTFYGLDVLDKFSFTGDIGEWINIIIKDNISFNAGSYANEVYMQSQLIQGELVIPQGITTIPDSMFRDWKNITSIVLPDGITNIGRNAFQNIKTLQSINIPDSVINIEKQAFYNCESLESIELPAHLSTIKDMTFYCCYNLTQVVLPSNLKIIGNYAFFKAGLTDIVLPNGLQTIGNSAFSFNKFSEIVIPKSVIYVASEAFQYNDNLSTIYCEAVSQPDQWDYNWDKKDVSSTKYDVQWGYVPTAV